MLMTYRTFGETRHETLLELSPPRWAFVGGGHVCGHCCAKLLPSDRQRLCRGTTTVLAMCVSPWLCFGLPSTVRRLE
jgi:hypothetical protein